MAAAIVPDREPEPLLRPLGEYLRHLNCAAYCAAVGGVLVATVSDYVKNQPGSVMEKLGMGMFPTNEYRLVLALLLLVVTGSFFCWIFEPKSRVDGFMRGVSALSLLTIVAPHPLDRPLKAQPAPESLVRPATTPMSTASYRDGLWLRAQNGTVLVKLLVDRGDAQPFEALVTLRDASAGTMVARQRVQVTQFEVAQARGQYVLDVEADGYRRASTSIEIGAESVVYEVPLERSSVPIGVQRFYPADTVVPTLAEPTRPIQ